ncbi:MAG TPA: ABC transporter permease [Thermoanaerobaculia bacterium]|jgi:putative ABC transport system permease protein|nr:ABC transporter permease [Thermoanaerobaculia bacterium]
MVDLARKNLLHDKLRFLITVSGVAFAVTLVFVQVGLFLGLLDNASITIEHLDADLWVTSHNTPNVDFAHTFPESYVDRVRSVPGVAAADNLIVWFMTVALPSGAQEGALVYALPDFARWKLPWHVAEGNLADLRRGRYLFLDDSAKKRFGAFHTGEYREVLDTRMKIIGRSQEALSFSTTPIAFVDFRRAQSLSPDQLLGRTTYILIKLAPGADVEAVRREVSRRLPYNDVHTRAEWASQSRRYWVESTGLGLNLAMTILLGCLVGVVVVAQTLYTSTMEHLKEFGTVKAIGGSNLDIYRILGKQAAIAAVIGFVLGAVPAYLLRPLLAKVDLKLIITPDFAAVVFAGTLALCLAAAIISFRKVAGIDPALVFRG